MKNLLIKRKGKNDEEVMQVGDLGGPKPQNNMKVFQKATWFSLGLSTGAIIAAITALTVQLLR